MKSTAKNIKGSILISFLICPLLSAPLILRALYRGHYASLNYLAILMGLIAYLWIPSGDLYRFYYEYDIIKKCSFNDIWYFCEFDYIIPYMMYFFSKLNLNFEYFRLFICVFDYYLIFIVLKDIIQKSNYGSTNTIRFKLFVIMFGLLKFGTFLTGARFTFSFALMMYGLYQAFYLKKSIGIFFFILACLGHYSYWPVLVLALICKLINPTFSRKFVFLLCIFAGLASSILLVALLNQVSLGVEMMDRIENYTTGYFANGELGDHNIFFKLMQIVFILQFYFLSVIAGLRCKSFKNCQLFVCLFLFCLLLLNMNTAFNRYATLASFALLPYFLLNSDRYFKKIDLNIMYYLSIFIFVISIYGTKRELSRGNQYLIATPLPVLLQHGYDYNWINRNIQNDGNIVGND